MTGSLQNLPNEILFTILNYLPPEEEGTTADSIRTKSNLIPLSLTSTPFRDKIQPILNSTFKFHSEQQLSNYLSARLSTTNFLNNKLEFWTQSIELLRPSYSRDRNGIWEIEGEGGMKRLLKTLSTSRVESGNLTVLKLSGIDWNMLDFLLEWMKEVRSENGKKLESEWEGEQEDQQTFSSKLRSLSFDFEQRTTRTFLSSNTSPYLEYSDQDGLVSNLPSAEKEEIISSTYSKNLLVTCLTTFTQLQTLRVSHLPSAPPSMLPGLPGLLKELLGVTSTLQTFEFVESIISDSTLFSIFNSTTKLRHLTIKNCRGFTVAGITTALELVLPTLESLNLHFDPPISTTYIVPSPFPSSFSLRLTPTSPNLTRIALKPPSISPLIILVSLLDPILPLATSLVSLSITGPLISLPSLQLALSNSLPRIKELELNNLSFWGNEGNLISNRSIGIREIWVKGKEKGVELKGNEFKIWEERMIWAELICLGQSDDDGDKVEGRGLLKVEKEDLKIGVEITSTSSNLVKKKRKRPGVCKE